MSPRSPKSVRPIFLSISVTSQATDTISIQIISGLINFIPVLNRSLRSLHRNDFKEELIHKCVFNGKQCDIDSDFQVQVDPTFGNCYTFNHNRSYEFSSTRAGPTYGLRLLLYVGEEVLPTTEATGIRMTVHDKVEFPFPDTFGYSAPTGAISSFGVRMKVVDRLPAPYGNCLPGGNLKNYIYEGYEYSMEGCYRSCFQYLVVRECACGDPRFPVLEGGIHCDAADPVARRCLEEATRKLSAMQGSKEFSCDCPQRCKQSMYDVTYSAAIWPASKLRVTPPNCTLDEDGCRAYYQKYGAMLEVFYEQLNFEMLIESSAYGMAGMMADFGGQLGLWLGVSVITVVEFLALLFRFGLVSGVHQYHLYRLRQLEKKGKKQEK